MLHKTQMKRSLKTKYFEDICIQLRIFYLVHSIGMFVVNLRFRKDGRAIFASHLSRYRPLCMRLELENVKNRRATDRTKKLAQLNPAGYLGGNPRVNSTNLCFLSMFLSQSVCDVRK